MRQPLWNLSVWQRAYRYNTSVWTVGEFWRRSITVSYSNCQNAAGQRSQHISAFVAVISEKTESTEQRQRNSPRILALSLYIYIYVSLSFIKHWQRKCRGLFLQLQRRSPVKSFSSLVIIRCGYVVRQQNNPAVDPQKSTSVKINETL